MLLGIKDLLKLVKEKKLVENLCEREMKNPEGAGFDLQMGEVFEISGDGYLGIKERDTPETKSVVKYEEGKNNSFVLKIFYINLNKRINIMFKRIISKWWFYLLLIILYSIYQKSRHLPLL